MKNHIFPALKLTLLSLVLLVVVYPALVWAVAQFAPNKGRVVFSEKNGKTVGAANVGQKFTEDKYFWSRPSAVDYNAAGSGGSNKGPSNPDYLAQVAARIDTFLVHNPAVKRADVPAELVTASGSGLDPHLSPEGALVQVERVARARKIPVEKVVALVESQTEKPLLGLFGPAKINVLALNLALDSL